MVVDDEIVYVGEAENFRKRFNSGYGNISPRNCYINGRTTNCRINSKVIELFEESKRSKLYINLTKEFKKVEHEIISLINPKWNFKK